MAMRAPAVARATRGRVSRMLLSAVLALQGCASQPIPAPNELPSPTPRTAAVAAGEVLARGERFVVYTPQREDTLQSIAARFLGSEDKDWLIAEFNGSARVDAGQPLAVPLEAWNPIGVYAGQYQTVPILCYHRFGNGTGGKMVVSAASFAAQLDWLARNDYRVIRLSQLLGYLQGRQALPKRSVVITIDDGYESVHRYAFPLLRKHRFAATVFVYTDFLGAGDALTWPQLQEMAYSGLIDIQPHSKSHRNLIERSAAETDERYRQDLEAEARVPREILERRLSTLVRHYALPYGDANELVLDVLARQRYQLAVTVNPGGNPFFAQPLMLRRTMIFGDQDLEAFKSRLQTSRSFALP